MLMDDTTVPATSATADRIQSFYEFCELSKQQSFLLSVLFPFGRPKLFRFLWEEGLCRSTHREQLPSKKQQVQLPLFWLGLPYRQGFVPLTEFSMESKDEFDGMCSS